MCSEGGRDGSALTKGSGGTAGDEGERKKEVGLKEREEEGMLGQEKRWVSGVVGSGGVREGRRVMKNGKKQTRNAEGKNRKCAGSIKKSKWRRNGILQCRRMVGSKFCVEDSQRNDSFVYFPS